MALTESGQGVSSFAEVALDHLGFFAAGIRCAAVHSDHGRAAPLAQAAHLLPKIAFLIHDDTHLEEEKASTLAVYQRHGVPSVNSIQLDEGRDVRFLSDGDASAHGQGEGQRVPQPFGLSGKHHQTPA